MTSEKTDSSSENLSKNRLRITKRIDDFLMQYPNAKPKYVATMLKLSHKKYAAMISTEKTKIRRYLGFGRPHRPHRRVKTTQIEADELALVKAICVGRRVKNRWYRASNRNRMMCFIGDHASVKVWESGTVRVEPHVDMTEKDLQDFFFEALNVAAGVPFEPANRLADSLVTASLHRVFLVGEAVPRFRIDHYKDSLGLVLYSDDSHPNMIEAEEGWPPWVKSQIQVINGQIKTTAELARQIGLHLSVMKAIDKSAKDLGDAVEAFNGALNRKQDEPTADISVILEGPHHPALSVILEGQKRASEDSPVP